MEGCLSCAVLRSGTCLEHTCPDCGAAAEGGHECDLRCPDCGEAPCHPQCVSGGGL